MVNCIFCRIIAQEIPSSVVMETDDIIVIKDINPKAPIHYLIIPKIHLASINDFTKEHQDIAGTMLLTARDIAQNNNITSFRLISNNGAQVGQSVFHAHIHFLAGKQYTDF